MSKFFEWGFKGLIAAACLLAVSYIQEISKTIGSMDLKFGVAIAKLQEQTEFNQAIVHDHETRIRAIEHNK